MKTALRPLEIHVQIFDLKQWLCRHHIPRKRGFSASFRPSPTRFKAMTVMLMNTPGKAVKNHAVRNWSLPSPIMLPHDTTLGSPMPKKDRPDSIRSEERRAGKEWGSTCRYRW